MHVYTYVHVTAPTLIMLEAKGNVDRQAYVYIVYVHVAREWIEDSKLSHLGWHSYMYIYMYMVIRYEASKVKQTTKANQHSTPKAVTFPKKNELPRVGLEPTTRTLHSRQSALY